MKRKTIDRSGLGLAGIHPTAESGRISATASFVAAVKPGGISDAAGKRKLGVGLCAAPFCEGASRSRRDCSGLAVSPAFVIT